MFSSISAGVFLGDGSGLTNIVAPYLPLSGGTVTGSITATNNLTISGSIQADNITDTHGGTLVKKKSFLIFYQDKFI